MQSTKDNTPHWNYWQIMKVIFFTLFALLLLGWVGKADQEFEQLEAETTRQILLDNGIITE